MKTYILIIVALLFIGTTVFAQEIKTTDVKVVEELKPTTPEETRLNEKSKNDTTIESTGSSSYVPFAKAERKYCFTIESGSIIENTSLDYRLFTTGNIDEYKQTISDGLLEQNILSIRSKTGVSYSKKAFANKIGYSLGFYDRTEVDFGFSKDLFDLVFFGNEMFMGKQINLNNTYLSATKFQQINLSLSRIIKLNNSIQYLPNQIEVGLGYSYLIGNHHIDFSTNDSYIEIGNDGEYINTNLNFTANNTDTNKINTFAQQGSGYTLDFFLSLKKEDNNIHFSVTDLGGINWNKNAVNYSSQKEISFSGLDIDNLLTINDSLIQIQLDSLADIDFVKKGTKFKTYLPTTYHLAYKRDLNINHIDYVVIGRIGKYRKGLIPTNFKPKYYIGTNFSHRGIHLKTSYCVGGYSKSAWQMEIGQNMLWQHFQLVLGTHHFGSIFKGINSSNADFYFSLNFLFGKKV